MKRKIVAAAALLAAASPTYAIFGFGDIVFDPSTYAEVVSNVKVALDAYQTAEQAKQNFLQAAAFFESPAAWKSLLANATNQMALQNGIPSQQLPVYTVQTLETSQQAALAALKAAQNLQSYQPTAENAAMLSLLQLQTAQANIQLNQAQARATFDQQVSFYQSSSGFAPQSQAMSSWSLK